MTPVPHAPELRERLAKALTPEVLERAEKAGFRQLYADIEPPREPKAWAAVRDVLVDVLVSALAPLVATDEPEVEVRLKDVVCPQCRKEFQLTWNDWSDKKATLEIRGCPSGGIYDVAIGCPHCDYEEQL